MPAEACPKSDWVLDVEAPKGLGAAEGFPKPDAWLVVTEAWPKGDAWVLDVEAPEAPKGLGVADGLPKPDACAIGVAVPKLGVAVAKPKEDAAVVAGAVVPSGLLKEPNNEPCAGADVAGLLGAPKTGCAGVENPAGLLVPPGIS